MLSPLEFLFFSHKTRKKQIWLLLSVRRLHRHIVISPIWSTRFYSQVTLTKSEWLTGFPIALYAAQWYVPVAVLLMLTIIQGFPKNTTSPSLPFSNTLVQMTFGVGLPVALQNKVRFEPSLTVWSPLGLLVKLVSTKKNVIKRQPSCRFVGKNMNTLILIIG